MDKNFRLNALKHEINNLFFKIETASELLSENELSNKERQEAFRILKSNIELLKVLIDNLIVLETLNKKEKIDLYDFFEKTVSKRYINGYPNALKRALENLKFLGVDFYMENDVLQINRIPEDKISGYLLYLTEYFFKLNCIKMIQKESDD
ncbi:hypothetical protein [Persephonella sp.]|uniref:hypothetical protein n=1 Tax=Persephonella sp. TaxID=2060922 RepID=UPI002605F248|nr:hypothetical protein [Persephonella sp.]